MVQAAFKGHPTLTFNSREMNALQSLINISTKTVKYLQIQNEWQIEFKGFHATSQSMKRNTSTTK